MKRIIIEFLIGIPVIILGYLLLEFIYSTFITHTRFVFDFKTCGTVILVWLVVEIVTYLFRKGKDNN